MVRRPGESVESSPMRPLCAIATTLLLTGLTASAAADWSDCPAGGDSAALRSCLTRYLTDEPAIEAALRDALDDSRAALRDPLVAAVATSRPQLADARPDLGGLLLEVDALAATGRGDSGRAWELYRKALALDNGTRTLSWYRDAARVWTVPLDIGSGRLVRAARGALAAGDREAAARLVTAAAELGFDPASEPWSSDLPGPPTSVVRALPWFKPIPDFDIGLINRDIPFRLSALKGAVVILDFWATWCGPCRRELPELQSFHQERDDPDLVTVTVNVGESNETALSFAAEMGLTLPIGRYEPRLENLFPSSALPMLIVIDRKGRMRGRWDGYTDSLDKELATLVDRLLAEREDPPGRELARVLGAQPELEVRWMRRGTGRIYAVDVVEVGGEPRIVTAEGHTLGQYYYDGRVHDLWSGIPPVTVLRRMPGGEPDRWVGFRPAAGDVFLIDAANKTIAEVQVGAPVFDVLPQADGSVLLATLEGLREWSGGEGQLRLLGTPTIVSAVHRAAEGLVLVGSGGSVRIVDGDGVELRALRAVPSAWAVIAGGTGWGLADAGVSGSVRGNFMRGNGGQVAVVTEAEQIVVLDEADGRVRWRAAWPGVSDVAAADLDGDGLDELLVVAHRKLAVLGAVKPDATPDKRDLQIDASDPSADAAVLDSVSSE